MRLISQPNGGVSVARNRGIDEAFGTWIAFLDADDEYLPAFLEKARQAIDRFPDAGIAYARAIWKKGDARLNLPRDRVKNPRLLNDYLMFVAREGGYEMHSSATIIRRAVFDRAGRFPVGVTVGEDTDMWMRAAWTSPVVYIPEDLAIYHMDAGDSGWESQTDATPFWLETYRQWLSSARIPAQFLGSSESYYLKFVLEKALAKALRSERGAAIGEWRTAAFRRNAPRQLAVKTLLFALAPNWFTKAWRRRIAST